MIAFDILATAIEHSDVSEGHLSAEGFEKILESYDLELEPFEKDFFEYYRQGKAK